MAIYEIVPNISEGRDAALIRDVVEAIESSGARVLHATSDEAHHRSVLTITGSDVHVLDAAVILAGITTQRIDLRSHRGVHPRIGALDVLPFVPLVDASMERAVELAHEAAARIWDRYRVPSFFYGYAASRPERSLLARVRKGEFEGLTERFADPAWRPDTGDIARHEGAGAIAIGARDILIAYNVDLATGDLRVAQSIARALRESTGGFRTLRALGLPLRDGVVQISLNVTNFGATPLYRIVEAIRELCARHGVTILRGELIGCLPREAVVATARYYLGL